jgi:hypothetical protein
MDQTLAQRIKSTYPGKYDDIPDSELEARVTAKYPGVYDDMPRTAAEEHAGATITGESAPPPAPEGEKGVGARLGHQVGLTVRGGVEGGASLPLAAGNILNTLINLGIGKYNEMSGTNIPKLSMPGEVVSRRLTEAGVAVPETPVEEAVLAATKGMAGAGSIAGGAGMLAPTSAVGQGVAKTLATSPGLQITSGLTSGASADVARQAGAGPLGQMAAGMAGGLIPSVPAATGAVARDVMRGDPLKVQQNIADFKRAGTFPSAGQATEGFGAEGVENMLSRVPGSAGTMRGQRIGQQAEIGAKVGDIAEGLYPGADPTLAGRQIEKGINSFVNQFKAKAGDLYDRVDQFVPPDQEVPVAGYKAVLDKLTSPNPGAPASTGMLIQPKIKSMASALESDLNPQLVGQPVTMASGQTWTISPELQRVLGVTAPSKSTLPYGALKDLRSRVGDMLSTNELLSDIPRGQLKQIYAGLSNDMETAAIINDADAGYYGPAGAILSSALKSGQPVPPSVLAALKTKPGPALASINRANGYYKAGAERIEQLQKVAGKVDYEKMFAAATSGAKEGASQIRLVMKSLPPEARDAVSAAMIKRLGQATAGNQDAAGGIFSSETFLTNWNKLSPQAKTQLFTDSDLRGDLDAVAKASANMRFGKRPFGNPSGSGAAVTQGATIGGAIVAALSGQFVPAAAIAGTMVGANLGARLMTSPTFVRWLAQNGKASPEQLGAQLNNLAQVMGDAQGKADVEALRDRLAPPPKMKAGGSVTARQLLTASKRYARS